MFYDFREIFQMESDCQSHEPQRKTTMKNILANAFSLQMLNLEENNVVEFTPIELDEVKSYVQNGFVSAVGHQDTANVLSKLLGTKIDFNRINVRLEECDHLIVAQVIGGCLPEGATALPEGVTIKFVEVSIL